MNKKTTFLAVIFSISLIFVFVSIFREDVEVYESSLYSWKLDKVLEDPEKFYEVLEEYNVKVLYQDFSSEFLEENDDSFLKDMSEREITVYHLAGDPSWGHSEGYEKIKREIKKVLTYNEKVDNPIKGIILDIEPYVSEKNEEFSVEDFEVYVDQIEKSYEYCQKHELEMRLAIPYWFDSIDDDLLKKVIKNSDGVSVMNYNISKTSSKIEREVELANRYGKKIDSIYEIEYGKEGYFASKEDIFEDFAKLKEENPSENLMISYHHYGSMG